MSQWYDPEPGPASTTGVMARELVCRGHDVHVLTGFPNYPIGKVMEGYDQRLRKRELLDGVKVTRVPLYTSHDRSAVKRVANYASFGLSAALVGVPSLPKLDALWVNYSPITLALPMWMQQLVHRTPTVCEVADLWPDTLMVAGLDGAGLLTKTATGMLNSWCRAMYQTSAAVVHISPGAGAVLQARGVPRENLHYIPKAADEGVFNPSGASLRQELGISEEATVLLYAGAMGEAQGLDSLVAACARVDDPRLIVLLAGSGTRELELRDQVAQLGVESVRFLGRVPQEKMNDLLATADMAYVGLAWHATSVITMPSKTQTILAAGKALLVAADGDVADLAENSGVGLVARSGEANAVAAAIRNALLLGRKELAAMGRRARSLYMTDFSVSRLGKQAESLLESIVVDQKRCTQLGNHVCKERSDGAK